MDLLKYSDDQDAEWTKKSKMNEEVIKKNFNLKKKYLKIV